MFRVSLSLKVDPSGFNVTVCNSDIEPELTVCGEIIKSPKVRTLGCGRGISQVIVMFLL